MNVTKQQNNNDILNNSIIQWYFDSLSTEVHSLFEKVKQKNHPCDGKGLLLKKLSTLNGGPYTQLFQEALEEELQIQYQKKNYYLFIQIGDFDKAKEITRSFSSIGQAEALVEIAQKEGTGDFELIRKLANEKVDWQTDSVLFDLAQLEGDVAAMRKRQSSVQEHQVKNLITIESIEKIGHFKEAKEKVHFLDKHKQRNLFRLIALEEAKYGNYTEAKKTATVLQEEDDSDHYYDQIKVLIQINELEGKGNFEEVIQKIPKSNNSNWTSLMYEELALAQARYGDFIAARQSMNMIKMLDVKTNVLGDILFLEGDIHTAKKIANKASNDELLLKIAITESQSGNFKEARNTIKTMKGHSIDDKCKHLLIIIDIAVNNWNFEEAKNTLDLIKTPEQKLIGLFVIIDSLNKCLENKELCEKAYAFILNTYQNHINAKQEEINNKKQELTALLRLQGLSNVNGVNAT